MVVHLQKAAKVEGVEQQEDTQSKACFSSSALAGEARMCMSRMPRQRALQTKARTSAHMHETID